MSNKYRKKPVVIEAVQWTGENVDEVLTFGDTGPAGLWGDDFKIDTARGQVVIRTLEGSMTASVGDWIIRGVKGEFYPCKDDIFRQTYDPVPDCRAGDDFTYLAGNIVGRGDRGL